MKKLLISLILAIFGLPGALDAQQIVHNPGANHGNKLEPLDAIFPSANVYRTGSGAPGSQYWQQQADYDIYVRLDDQEQRIYGLEKVTYHNNSPDVLAYLWMQLDENQNHPKAEGQVASESTIEADFGPDQLEQVMTTSARELGVKVISVKDMQGRALAHQVQGTMLRITPPEDIAPGSTIEFQVEWSYNMIDRTHDQGPRGGFEYFPEDDNYLFVVTQWFPRMAVYSDYQGWHNKQFLGSGEFALNFGKYTVSIELPDDYVVAATGECQNYEQVLTKTQYARLQQARKSDQPIEIITLDEALANAAKTPSQKTKVWKYEATDVRDFAWTASRRYVWDAMNVEVEGADPILAMSLYGKEAYPLFGRYSTPLIALTLKTYSKHTLPYPYPVAISVESANEMEYPMIAFNMGRVDENGEYTEAYRDYMIWIIIHEVGHNFFPMIVNTDERQWTFMDEGMNTFLQLLTEREWQRDFPSRGDGAYKIAPYMAWDKNLLEPTMTTSDNTSSHDRAFYNGQYLKPAIALQVLRETVMGRELFDFAFKTYVDRWAFKHPTPYDFFRTMEDASAMDLDWFWRGWFFSTDAVDLSLEKVSAYEIDAQGGKLALQALAPGKPIAEHEEHILNFNPYLEENPNPTLLESSERLQDHFYPETSKRTQAETRRREQIRAQIKAHVPDNDLQSKYVYEATIKNKGKLLMPLILKWVYEDGTEEIERIPVSIWRKNESQITKTFAKQKKVKHLILDPFNETADIDLSNHIWTF